MELPGATLAADRPPGSAPTPQKAPDTQPGTPQIACICRRTARWLSCRDLTREFQTPRCSEQMVTWHALAAPPKTPTAIVEKINAAVNNALHDSTVVKRFAKTINTAAPTIGEFHMQVQ
ncbi:MAG: hypothetical protein ACRECV_00685 [Xanthobacteraceae bacterium]